MPASRVPSGAFDIFGKSGFQNETHEPRRVKIRVCQHAHWNGKIRKNRAFPSLNGIQKCPSNCNRDSIGFNMKKSTFEFQQSDHSKGEVKREIGKTERYSTFQYAFFQYVLKRDGSHFSVPQNLGVPKILGSPGSGTVSGDGYRGKSNGPSKMVGSPGPGTVPGTGHAPRGRGTVPGAGVRAAPSTFDKRQE